MSLNVTPDGFCDHGAVVADEEHHKVINDLMRTADTVLLGRTTFQLFESHWPAIAKTKAGTDAVVEFAGLIDNAAKIVFSKSLQKVDWQNSTIFPEINGDELRDLKQKPGRDIIILGSPGIVSSLTELGLIDQYNFMIQPILGGKGKRLFDTSEALGKMPSLNHIRTQTLKSGVTGVWYQAATNQ